MAENKLQETEDGYYVQNGDIQEWRWNEGHEPAVAVPKGEFDPRSAPNPNVPEPEPEPKPKKK